MWHKVRYPIATTKEYLKTDDTEYIVTDTSTNKNWNHSDWVWACLGAWFYLCKQGYSQV